MFWALLLVALILFVVGFVTAAKFLLVVALVALVLGLLFGYRGRDRDLL